MTTLTELAQVTADKLVEQHHVGVVVAAVAGDAAAVCGAGRIGGTRPQPPDAGTLFEIGSVTKVFTSLALARMAVADAVALSEPLADLLPPWSTVPSRDGRQITLEHLSTHTSGLPRLPKGMLGRALLPWGTPPDPYAECTEDVLLRGLAATKLGAVPGKRFRYSNLGGGLLGLALGHRAGLGYEALVEREILKPLGMRDTVVEVGPDRAERFAAGHDKRGNPVPHWHLAALAGAGGIRSTGADMVAFVRAQLAPEDGDFADAVRLTREIEFDYGVIHTHLGWMSSSPAYAKGVGPSDGSRVFWHNGRTGGFSSFVGVQAERGAGIVVLSNTGRMLDRQAMALLRAVEAVSGS
ncbi:MAG: beta-lactamase family protein [Streptomycetaceae bacterium]|nr:beta-lactamase family protein [Streptomycetaceae bacterium]